VKFPEFLHQFAAPAKGAFTDNFIQQSSPAIISSTQGAAMTTASVTKDLKAVQFAVSYEGHPVSARITAAALRSISANEISSLREPQLLAAFRDHKDLIEAMALERVAAGEPDIELSAGCFN
jgi:hypothetical protein